MIAIPKIVSLTFLFAGAFLLVQVVMPIVSFQIWQLGQSFDEESILVSPQKGTRQSVLGVSVESKNNFPAFISTNKRELPPPYTQFRISVPKLQLSDAAVFVESNDLTKGLVHLPGTALPGERGNIFISGHSAISPLIKTALFAKLIDLKKGDQITLEAEGTKFTYQIISLKVVDPKDTSVINPPDKMGRYISLMTCVPPGLNFKRLIVLGKII